MVHGDSINGMTCDWPVWCLSIGSTHLTLHSSSSIWVAQVHQRKPWLITSEPREIFLTFERIRMWYCISTGALLWALFIQIWHGIMKYQNLYVAITKENKNSITLKFNVATEEVSIMWCMELALWCWSLYQILVVGGDSVNRMYKTNMASHLHLQCIHSADLMLILCLSSSNIAYCSGDLFSP